MNCCTARNNFVSKILQEILSFANSDQINLSRAKQTTTTSLNVTTITINSFKA
jgi:hypothetical protein